MAKKKEIQPPSVLKQMEAASRHVICAPFNDQKCWITARILNYVQIKSCGDFSLIETLQDKADRHAREGGDITFHEAVQTAELQHRIVEKALLSPSYDDIVKMILKYDDVGSIENQLKSIEDKLTELKKTDHKGVKKLQEEYAMLELEYKYVLPADFLTFVFSFALDIDSSDIKKVSEEMLYNAAVKAKLGNDNPADHIKGLFTDFNREDINDRAWVEFFKRQKDQKPNKRGA